MRYRIVYFVDEMAIERSFMGMFKRYKDLKHFYWWSMDSPYFKDCLTKNSGLIDYHLRFRNGSDKATKID